MANPENVESGEGADTRVLRRRLKALAQAEANGLLPFRRVMGEALYGEGGYYSSGRARVGRGGDFFTSVSVGPVFGRLLARRVLEVWRGRGEPERFSLVEQGANDGQLLADILDELARLEPRIAEAAEPWILEPLPVLRARQEELLDGRSVSWAEDLGGLPKGLPPGILYANELVDAFPVDWIRRVGGGEWEECCLGHGIRECPDERGGAAGSGIRQNSDEGESGTFLWRPLQDPRRKAEASRIAETYRLPPDYETELHLAAEDWVAELAESNFAGEVLLLDYGFLEDDFYHPDRRTGTLQAYRSHEKVEIDPGVLGEVDLTAHVNFSGLIRTAEARGMRKVEFASQGAFLTDLAREWLLGIESGEGADAELGAGELAALVRQFQTLTHPGLLGGKFHALVLRKAS